MTNPRIEIKYPNMKIYTKGGDKGFTSLVQGQRVKKDSVRIEAYGMVDELNSSIGILDALVNDEFLKKDFNLLQHQLFDLGSLLACKDKMEYLPDITDEDVIYLEKRIDEMVAELPVLKHFILPGGSLAVAQAHVVRTICRKAERRCITLADVEEIDEVLIKFLNRLSDYFFIVARKIGQNEGVKEIIWENTKTKK